MRSLNTNLFYVFSTSFLRNWYYGVRELHILYILGRICPCKESKNHKRNMTKTVVFVRLQK